MNLSHFARTVLFAGELCIEIPRDISDLLLHPCTAQRSEGISDKFSKFFVTFSELKTHCDVFLCAYTVVPLCLC